MVAVILAAVILAVVTQYNLRSAKVPVAGSNPDAEQQSKTATADLFLSQRFFIFVYYFINMIKGAKGIIDAGRLLTN